ncbi:phosphatase PAP2 family protein [Arthrobacter bambusae]|uniref:phosphatase PAP2 family protein n=1 Tax=Arthrobacter bambusae TaxID=1338426 RepID=UPI00277F7DCD|nr:phosphatase PAP2 family protein [Arthrobacter bambusae]MDQ0029448.1 undecaprenyl-diphosphatase [Arthrobacter bambusae]MDQ0097108.1 undecaprenyl-diphosphatase [Arthrobacter bambusae]
MPSDAQQNASTEGRTFAAVRNDVPLLPQPRFWLLWGIALAAVVLAISFSVQSVAGLTTNEFGVDQELSRHHVGALTTVAMALNFLFAPVAGVCLVLLIGLYLFLVRKSVIRAVMFVLFACSGWVASEAFKLIVARHRPNPALLFDPLAPETGSNSFPSGHTAFAVALAFALYFLVRGTRWGVITAWAGAVLAVVVAWSRLYIGVHYPSDVVASFLATSAAVIVLAGLWNRYAPRVIGRLPFGVAPEASASEAAASQAHGS